MWTTQLVIIRVGNQTYEYSPDMPFTRAVRDAATQAGWSLFTVHIGGKEIEPHEAPLTVGDAQGEIIISPYQTAGG